MPKLSVDTFLAALTVASLTAGCAKATDATRAAPEPAVTAQPASAPAAATPPVATVESLGAIDAGIERQKAPAASAPRAKASANAGCGAGTCSDDMKK